MSILIVDDEVAVCRLVSSVLRKKGWETFACHSGGDALRVIADRDIDILFLDINLPDMSGLDLLEETRRVSPQTVVMMMTGIDDIKTVIRCIRQGAEEYFLKPVNAEELLLAVGRVEKTRQLRYELSLLRDSFSPPLMGNSTQMHAVHDLITRAAATADTTVLVTGETGTGKELVARHIHLQSARSGGPFVPVNCSSVPETLIESEFFGHEKGAFTGADRQQKGIFERAHGGTVFLDEIGDMDSRLQTKLLRLLEDKRVYRLGGGETTVDVRVLCATNKDLAAEVAAGRFRQDLYYRVNILNIHLPPLRDRPDDILLLAQFFIAKFCQQKHPAVIGEAGARRLRAYGWPGNVRELRNVIERELLLARGDVLEFSQLDDTRRAGGDGKDCFLFVPLADKVDLDAVERRVIERALELQGNNISRTAEFLGLGRSSLRSKMDKHGLNEEVAKK